MSKRKNIEISNQQTIKKINTKKVSAMLEKIFSLLNKPSAKVSVLFCDNRFISRLNKKFFGKFRPTDVIAFPLRDSFDMEYLGEVVISVEKAKKVCDFYKKKWQEELILYAIHGILHLVGYDDIKAKEKIIMERKQEAILLKLLQKNKKIIYDIGC